ncbi:MULTISPECIES: site-specific integrase [Aequorivita]|uniref:Site-specific integrase n=1 Tax=Aequorivita iocasae TaxID=2803865 RepID=A0ABX7DQN2_9FLAO|nr:MULTISPECIES: site-specific integrase [Aequorivita]QQX76446.1 site-specific integrase [Aequorivita iocasae]UCA55918.1 site-specific integrase [Aequorivita sp. F7]
MQSTFSILFYPKGNDIDKNGNSPIYARITVNNKRSEFSIRRKVSLSKWNSEAGTIRGSSSEVGDFNKYTAAIRIKLHKIYEKLLEEDIIITSAMIKNIYLGKNIKHKMLLEIFQEHNDKVENLIGRDFAAGTAERYRTAKKHIGEYILKEYGNDDIPVKDVDHTFITGFEYYLKTTRNCSHNTAIKYITNFKKIIRIAYANDWINKDPFVHWKAKLKIVDREFLNESELQVLVEKDFGIPRLDQVKDVFVFSCFTGLAYADAKKLSSDNIILDISGERWIKIKRSKTDTRSSIPLLAIPQAIIEKYAESPETASGNLLPVLSNQKTNAYLKEIADLCGIKKNLTFHLARHTFATTVTLTNGVPIESVSKMLGHKSLKTTQHYAKIIDKKVSEDMKALKGKLANYSNMENASTNV